MPSEAVVVKTQKAESIAVLLLASVIVVGMQQGKQRSGSTPVNRRVP